MLKSNRIENSNKKVVNKINNNNNKSNINKIIHHINLFKKNKKFNKNPINSKCLKAINRSVCADIVLINSKRQ